MNIPKIYLGIIYIFRTFFGETLIHSFLEVCDEKKSCEWKKMNSHKYIHNIPSLDLAIFFIPLVDWTSPQKETKSQFWRFWDNKKVELTPGFLTCFQGMYLQNGGFVPNNVTANGFPWAIDFPSNWGNSNKCGGFPTEIWPFGDRNFWDPSFGHIHMAGLGTSSTTCSNRSSYVSIFCRK